MGAAQRCAAPSPVWGIFAVVGECYTGRFCSGMAFAQVQLMMFPYASCGRKMRIPCDFVHGLWELAWTRFAALAGDRYFGFRGIAAKITAWKNVGAAFCRPLPPGNGDEKDDGRLRGACWVFSRSFCYVCEKRERRSRAGVLWAFSHKVAAWNRTDRRCEDGTEVRACPAHGIGGVRSSRGADADARKFH
jgi:hypothetical protein